MVLLEDFGNIKLLKHLFQKMNIIDITKKYKDK